MTKEARMAVAVFDIREGPAEPKGHHKRYFYGGIR